MTSVTVTETLQLEEQGISLWLIGMAYDVQKQM